MNADGFGFVLEKKTKNKVSACFMKALTKSSISSFRRACSGFPIAERDSNCSESRM